MEKARGIMRFREEAKSGNGETRNFVGFRGGGAGSFRRGSRRSKGFERGFCRGSGAADDFC